MTNIRQIVFLFLIIFFTIAIQSYGQVSPQWTASFMLNPPLIVGMTAMALDKNGNIYELGQYYNGGPFTFLLNKYNSAGTLEWSKYHGPVTSPLFMEVDDSGNVFVVGSLGNNIWIIKYDPTGAILWNQTYSSGVNHFYCAAIDDSAAIYLVGKTQGHFTILKYDSSGTLKWANLGDTIIGIPGYDWYITFDKNHSIYITSNYDSNHTCKLTKCTFDGNKIWDRTYSGNFASGRAWAGEVCTDQNANIYVLAQTDDGTPNYRNAALLKYDSSGNLKWTYIYSDSIFTAVSPAQFALDNDQNVYLAATCAYLNNAKRALVKVDSSGIQQWVKTYNSNSNIDFSGGMGIDLQGFIYVTGTHSDILFEEKFLTIKYDFNGNVIWVDNYQTNQLSNDRGRLVCIDTVGNVYVSGTTSFDSPNGTYNGISTLKYSLPVNVNEKNSGGINAVKLFPNPFKDKLFLNFSDEIKNASLEIYDVMGRCVHATLDINEKSSLIQIENLECGIYFYRVTEKNILLATGKLLAK